MSDLLPIDLTEMVEEVRRECRMRRDVFGRAMREGRMNRRLGERRIDVMDAVLRFLERSRDACRRE